MSTSTIARDQHEACGKAQTHRELILSYLRTFCYAEGKTSGEIAAALKLERHESARRLPELRSSGEAFNGPARKCRVMGSQQMTWLWQPHRAPAAAENTEKHESEKQGTLW